MFRFFRLKAAVMVMRGAMKALYLNPESKVLVGIVSVLVQLSKLIAADRNIFLAAVAENIRLHYDIPKDIFTDAFQWAQRQVERVECGLPAEPIPEELVERARNSRR